MEGVTLELEGDSVLIESFVLKEEVIKKLKQFKAKVREMHYVFVLTTEPLYVTVIKCEKKIYQHIKNGGRQLCSIPFIILQSLEAIMNNQNIFMWIYLDLK